MIDLCALRILESRASAGPWRQGNVETHHVFAPWSGIGPERVVLRMNDKSNDWNWSADAALIVAMRNSVVAMADEIERLKIQFEPCLSIARRMVVLVASATDRAAAEDACRRVLGEMEAR